MANAARPSARARGYTTAWDRARLGFLRSHPHCVECAKEGLIISATVVDHVTPHRGDQRLFWDVTNWQPLCTGHHASDKQQVEGRGFSSRVDASGLPVDQRHPFFAGADDQAARVGGSEVAGSKGVGPLGFQNAELVNRRGRR